jgi:hypothetical protein
MQLFECNLLGLCNDRIKITFEGDKGLLFPWGKFTIV